MINTIFYFAETEQEYLDNFAKKLVKPYTIVFAKDTHALWKNGIKYSGTTVEEVDGMIDDVVSRDVAPLVTALNAALNEANSIAEMRSAALEQSLQETLQSLEETKRSAATEKTRLNGVINTLNSEIQGTVENLLQNARWIENNWPQGVTNWQLEWSTNLEAYLTTVGYWTEDPKTGDRITKWSQIELSVDGINSTVNNITKEGGSLSTLLSKINQEVTDRLEAISSLTNTYTRSTDDTKEILEWMYSALNTGAGKDKSFAELVTAAKSGDYTGISNINLLVTPVKDSKGNIISYRANNKFSAAVDDALTTILQDAGSNYANTQIISLVDDKVASLNTKVSNIDQQVLGIASNGNLTGTFVAKADYDSAISALRTADTQNSNAIGSIQTEIRRLDGDVNVNNSIAAKVNGAIATFEQNVSNGKALTALVNKVDENSSNVTTLIQKIDGDGASIGLAAKFNNLESGLVTNIDNRIASTGLVSKSGNNWVSSVYTKTETDGQIKQATAGLVATNDFNSASVVAKVNEAGSNVKIQADKITLEGSTTFKEAIGEMISAKAITQTDVEGAVLSVISDGNATFVGNVKASLFLAGDPDGLNISMTPTAITFNVGGKPRAWFTPNDLNGKLTEGMFMYVMNPDQSATNKIVTIDFANLLFKNTSDTNLVAHTVSFRLLAANTGTSNTSPVSIVKYYLGSKDGLYYQNSELTTKLTTLSTTKIFEPANVGGLEPHVIIYRDYTNDKNYRFYGVDFYHKISFQDGKKTVGTDLYGIVTYNLYDPDKSIDQSYYRYLICNGTATERIYAPNDNIYMESTNKKMSNGGETYYMFNNSVNYIDTVVLRTSTSLAPCGGPVTVFNPMSDSTKMYLNTGTTVK